MALAASGVPTVYGGMETHDRLFQIVDPVTNKLVDICTGPTPIGGCPRADTPPYDCIGLRVVPMRGTLADGLPFTATSARNGRCPLAWVDDDPE